MLSGKDAEGFSAMAVAILTRRSVRLRSPNSVVPKVSTAHVSGCSNPSPSICLVPFLYIASPSSLPEYVLTCQNVKEFGNYLMPNALKPFKNKFILNMFKKDEQ